MHSEIVEYYDGDTLLKGYLAYNKNTSQKKPAVIVAHAWRGQDDFARQKANDLAELGYVAFAADLYGKGIVASNDSEAADLMKPLFLDRQKLQNRIGSAFTTVSQLNNVDANNIGAIGFCFGGLTVIELFRSGKKIRGAVSFHGVITNSLQGQQAKTVPIAEEIEGSLLILHGHDDPLVSEQDIVNIQNELTKATVDWQFHIYGNAKHAFTNPLATEASSGLLFNEKANHRSWLSMKNFFNELFSPPLGH